MHILFNKKSNKYTMKEEIEGVKSENPKPPKYVPNFKYAKYRRQAKNL